MTDRLLERLCAIGIGIAPDFPAGEIFVDRELVLEAIRRIEAQNAEIERLRGVQRAVVALARIVIESGNPMANRPWIDVIHMMDEEACRD